MVDLHAHTSHSLFDGGVSPQERVKIAKELEHSAVAISDHGTMSGAVQLYNAAKEEGIKAIIGAELYFQPVCKEARESYHLCLYAKNLEGYKNLCRLTTYGEEHKYYKGLIDFAGLRKYHEGLICTTACIASYSSQAILKGETNKAEKYLHELKKIFGDDLYIELQPYDVGEDKQQKVDLILIDIAERFDIKTIFTSDSHYGKKEDFDTYLMMHEIAKHDSLDIENTYKERYIPTRKELEKRAKDFYYVHMSRMELKTLIAESMCNLDEIVEKCEENILDELPLTLPSIMENSDKKLKSEIIKGLKRRGKYTKEYIKRCQYEYDVIHHHGLEDYFLIVQDYVKWAKDHDIVVGAGRGSVCNCLVAYALEITDVDSLKFGLMFERFLRKDKLKYPDIDLDFETDRRNEVIEYLVDKYKGYSARISSYGKYGVDNLINDLAKSCNLPTDKDTEEEAIKTNKRIIADIKSHCARFVMDEKLDIAELNADPMTKIYNKSYNNIVKHFSKMYGKIRYYGAHAAGVAIVGNDLLDYTALRKNGNDFYTMYDLEDLDSIRVIKFDMLGLKTMGELRDMRQMCGLPINEFDERILEDKKVLEAMRNGETTGIFQFVNKTAKRILGDIETDSFMDVVAASSMNRPVPLKLKVPEQYAHNKKHIEEVKNSPYYEYTKDTYGTVVYQEQMIALCQNIGHMSWAETDIMLKIIKHELNEKTRKQADELKPIFVKGAIQEGMTKSDAEELFEAMLGYLFNKGHGTGYSIISVEQMSFKVYHPVIYWYVKLKYAKDEKQEDEFSEKAMKENNVVTFLPHVNLSKDEMSLRKEDGEHVLQKGLASVKGVGDKAAKVIYEERKRNGIFKSYDDFYDRCKSRLVTTRVIKVLEECGALEFNKQKYIKRVTKYNTALLMRGMK